MDKVLTRKASNTIDKPKINILHTWDSLSLSKELILTSIKPNIIGTISIPFDHIEDIMVSKHTLNIKIHIRLGIKITTTFGNFPTFEEGKFNHALHARIKKLLEYDHPRSITPLQRIR